MAQEMYKHDALLHLLWAIAQADTTLGDDLYSGVSSLEDIYYEKVAKAEGITIDFSDLAAKRKELGYDQERIISEALKATNGCGREWRTKVYGYMVRMSLESHEGSLNSEGEKTKISDKEYALYSRARKYFGLTEDEDDRIWSLTKA